MEVILDKKQVALALSDMAGEIVAANPSVADIAIVGIRSRGEVLARRLCDKLTAELGTDIPCGTLDITLYRDDINDPQGDEQPTVRATEIEFDISDKVIILVDDVLYTGRSVRAAMDALTDFGRPRAIRLAVLVDRGHHELPIRADYVGTRVDVPEGKTVAVNLVETDETDQVVVE